MCFRVLLLAASMVMCSCGGAEPVCGNGAKEAGEQCDDGNLDNTDSCRNDCIQQLPDTTDLTIKWEFNKEAAPQFSADSCLDIGASRVYVELEGPTPGTSDEMCSLRQVVFRDIASGTYTARLRVVDSQDQLKTTSVIVDTFEVGIQDVIREVVVEPDQWVDSYVGTFYFRVAWGSLDCDEAGVAQQELLLEQGGMPVAGFVTDSGDQIDGSAPAACRPLDTSVEDSPQSVLGLPFGAATFTVVGLDNTGEVQYSETFDTFVGAGANNPEYLFDVNGIGPDAGVPDAGAPDAAPSDAGEPDAGGPDASGPDASH